jgi:hypothetical protein
MNLSLTIALIVLLTAGALTTSRAVRREQSANVQ